ncbi:MAG: COG4315 family predicted lipoprotein [Candidatus Limnocylindrales bacterium]
MTRLPTALPATRRIALLAAVVALIVGACSTAAGGAGPATSGAPSSTQASSTPSATSMASASPAASASTGGYHGRSYPGGDGSSGSPTPAASPVGSGAAVTVATSPSIGQYLTGPGGRTLYVFGNDPMGATTSACTSATCVANWPPFALGTGEQVAAAAGVGGTFATITGERGRTQVTYNGRPLYFFAGDQAAGDTNGEGLTLDGGVWHAAKP